ncbi:DnaA/Hda family protein, partial [Patescibacteria group bacterium]|nr:DnaA/Hda family protein [Patescibacteria group bacterium]
MNLDQTWQSTLSEMELQISRANFITWLKKSVLLDRRDGVFTVALPNSFAKEWVESKYAKNILGIIRNMDSSVKKIDFIIAPNLFENNNNEKSDAKSAKSNQIGFEFSKIDPETNLNPRYTFDSFVVGSSNEFAYSAATAIIKEIGTKYNPLFIYGGVGLGKTHLIQAIGNEIKNNFKNQIKVKYVTSEKFTNDVVTAIRNKRMEDIKK